MVYLLHRFGVMIGEADWNRYEFDSIFTPSQYSATIVRLLDR